MATKKVTKTSRKAKKTTEAKSSNKTLGLLPKLIFIFLFLSVLGLAYLDFHIRAQFEGKRWAVPAKVYARPLELYSGLDLSIDDLKIELRGLGYKFVNKAISPGQVELSRTRAIIHTRGFQFSDGSEPTQKLMLSFSGSKITKLENYHGQAIALTRLEPILVGGIYPLNNEDRDLIRLEEAPDELKQALIAIEDKSFYRHPGISIRGISRAMLANIKAGRFIQGGSTLTQQLIKNFYLTADRTLARKLLEIPMALLLELHYSKEEILEAYLNEVYLGQEGSRAIHGFGLAAQYYFARPISELTLPQLAMLAGLVKGPSYLNPRQHPERALARRNLVLSELYKQEVIDKPTYLEASQSKLAVVKQASLLKGAYPAYLDLVKRQLREDYDEKDLNSEGLRVFTNLNPISQSKAVKALVKTIESLEKHYGEKVGGLQGSMIVTEPQTGEVLAVIGGRETRYQGFNRALDTERPIGSLVKPAVYLTALENGYHLASPLDDSPFELLMESGLAWQPENFDHQSHGNVQLHYALSRSYNLSTARLGMVLGLTNVIDTLQRLGVNKHIDPYPSLLLGAQGLSPLEIATMYQTIASNGFQMPLRAIRLVTDSSGQALSRYPFQLEQTIDGKTIHLLQYILQETARVGTARSIYYSIPDSINIAGKTGTSDQQRDSWFAGFAGNRLAVTWLGLDDNQSLPFTGSSGALRAWTEYMSKEVLTPFIAAAPEGIDYLWIDQQTGLVSAENCIGAQPMPFIIGQAPTEKTDCARNNVQEFIKPSLDWFNRWFR